MTNQRQISCTVAGEYFFQAQIVECRTPADHAIPPEFYLDYGVPVPEGTHWEVRLTVVPVWDGIEPSKIPLHIYQHPESGQRFVCYIDPIDTLEDAVDLFRSWCVGTMYTMEHSKDFTELEQEKGESWEDTISRVAGINITESVGLYD